MWMLIAPLALTTVWVVYLALHISSCALRLPTSLIRFASMNIASVSIERDLARRLMRRRLPQVPVRIFNPSSVVLPRKPFPLSAQVKEPIISHCVYSTDR